MVNVAMLSKWHVHAGGYAQEVLKLGHKITAVWDTDAERGKKWAAELGCDFEPDLAKVLARSDVDAVVVDTETSKHKEVILAAANAKKHVFTEKTLAVTESDALEMKAAIEKNGVKFTISFPYRTNPTILYAKQIVESGELGMVNTVRIRNAHGGASQNWLPAYWYVEADACGGAMMDLGCHPMYVASYLLGEPARITSIYTDLTNRGVEDNAVNLIEFKNKAIGIVETAFVTPSSPWMLEIYGTEGTMFGSDFKVRLSTPATQKYSRGFIDVTNLPKALPSAFEQWFAAIEKNEPAAFNIDDAVALSKLLEGAYISHKNNTIYNF